MGDAGRTYESRFRLEAGEYLLCCTLTNRSATLAVDGAPEAEEQTVRFAQPSGPTANPQMPGNLWSR